MQKLLAIALLLGALGLAVHQFANVTDEGVAPTAAPSPYLPPSPGTNEQMASEVDAIALSRNTISDAYAQLVAAANAGNPHAAYQLYQDAFRCENLGAKGSILEEYAASVGDERSTDEIVRQLAADEAFCTGVTDEQLALKNDWVVKAARLGHIEAQVLFFGAVTEHIKTPGDMVAHAEEIARHKVEALRHLQSAAKRGSDSALFNIALAYQEGTLARQDPVAAYAYMLALRNRGTTRAADQYLRRWGQGMTAGQIAEAVALSTRQGH